MESIKLNKFVVAGKVSSELEFLAFDSNSGGYPYASSTLNNIYRSPAEAFKDLPEAYSDHIRMKDPRVYRIVLEEVDVVFYDNDQKKVESVLDDLTKEQKQLLKEML